VSGRFRYRAATSTGQVVEGILQASTRQLVLDSLRRQQLYPVVVEETAAAPAARPGRRLGRRAAVGLWTRTAATLLGAGMPVDRVLGFTAQHSEHPELADVIRQVRQSVRQGMTLADALAGHRRYFDSLFVAMVASGESSGALDVVFERLSEQLEETAELRSQVISALLYPAIMAVVACVGVAVLLGFVIPRFATVLSDIGSTLPWSTRLLIDASRILTRGWWVWLLLLAAAVVATSRALARPEVRRRWDAARLGWPWIGDLEIKYWSARFARTLGLLLTSGVPAIPALKIARASAANLAIQEGVDRAAVSLAEGSALASALAGVLPPLALQMVSVGEQTGRLEQLCLRVADTYETEVRRSLRTAVTLLEPILILGFGMLVGFIALAMFQAIYGITLTAG
jgi:type II secretory pathway component PulF